MPICCRRAGLALRDRPIYMNITEFKVLTFDCYGTLIDWETGLINALSSLLNGEARINVTRNEALEAFARYELAQEEKTPGLLYPRVLANVYQQLATEWGQSVTSQEADAFGASVPEWPEFQDSRTALQYLKQHYKIAILSNVDRLSFSGSSKRLGIEFDAVYTAQDIGSYKPNARNFEYMLTRLRDDLGINSQQVLHVAQSLLHDHEPAKKIGLATAWIDRRHADTGWGATSPPTGKPSYDFHFHNLADLANAHRQAAISIGHHV
jgi:2-haloacid dehalogenase